MSRLRTLPALFLLALAGCAAVDKPLLYLRGVAGGIHNRRLATGMDPFFLPDGRLGCVSNGVVFLQEVPGGEMRALAPAFGTRAEVDDPVVSPDGTRLLFVSGRDQVTAGGGHNDHVWQVYSMGLDGTGWTRHTTSERAEVLPRYAADGSLVFVRRPDYEPYSLYESPWGKGCIMAAAADGSWERQLTEPVFHPFDGLTLSSDETSIVFGASPAPGEFHVYRVPFPDGGEPEVLVRDARLPVPLPDGAGFAFVRPGESTDVFVADWNGDVVSSLGLERSAILSLAVSPDGDRFVFSELAGSGRETRYELWQVPASGGEPERIHRAKARSPKRFKPLDFIRPFSWWGRGAEVSPGSR